MSQAQAATLNDQADAARSLWNLIHAYHEFHANQQRWPSWSEVDEAIRQARHEIPWLGVLPAQAAQQVLRTYRRAWENYWARTHGRPTWRSKRARRAVDVPQARDLNLTQLNRRWWSAQIPKVGRVKVRVQQRLPDRITGARIVRQANGWQLIVRGEDHAARLAACDPKRILGLDRGVTHTLADSEGRFLDMPDTITPAEVRRLHRLECKSARQRSHRPKRSRPSNRELRTYQQIAKLRARQARRRHDWTHQTTASLCRGNIGALAIEALNVKKMTASAHGTINQSGRRVAQKARLNRAILNQGWGQIERLLTYKAERSGRTVVKVKPQHTSQTCHRCGNVAAHQRESQALFCCQACGWNGSADTNAAINISTRAGRKVSALDVEAIAAGRPVKRQNPNRALARAA